MRSLVHEAGHQRGSATSTVAGLLSRCRSLYKLPADRVSWLLKAEAGLLACWHPSASCKHGQTPVNYPTLLPLARSDPQLHPVLASR